MAVTAVSQARVYVKACRAALFTCVRHGLGAVSRIRESDNEDRSGGRRSSLDDLLMASCCRSHHTPIFALGGRHALYYEMLSFIYSTLIRGEEVMFLLKSTMINSLGVDLQFGNFGTESRSKAFVRGCRLLIYQYIGLT